MVTSLAVGARVVVRGKFGESPSEQVIHATVAWCAEKTVGGFHAGLEFGDHGSPTDNDSLSKTPDELDCYEVMQLSPNADSDTIQRVYRILAQRYHPDSSETGNREAFLTLCEAYRILSNPELRAKYDARYRVTKQLHWKIFDQGEARKGPEVEQRKRRGILELLYAKAVQDPERASMNLFEIEQLLGCPREHLGFAFWYLKGKGYVTRADNARFAITIPGSDEVEGHGQPSEHRNQKLLES